MRVKPVDRARVKEILARLQAYQQYGHEQAASAASTRNSESNALREYIENAPEDLRFLLGLVVLPTRASAKRERIQAIYDRLLAYMEYRQGRRSSSKNGKAKMRDFVDALPGDMKYLIGLICPVRCKRKVNRAKSGVTSK